MTDQQLMEEIREIVEFRETGLERYPDVMRLCDIRKALRKYDNEKPKEELMDTVGVGRPDVDVHYLADLFDVSERFVRRVVKSVRQLEVSR